jgi:hypothetical protein
MLIRALLMTCAALAISGAAGEAQAEPYPARAITLVVPFPAGGPTDAIGRIVADGLGTALGKSVIRECARRDRQHRVRAGGSRAGGRLHADPRYRRDTRVQRGCV